MRPGIGAVIGYIVLYTLYIALAVTASYVTLFILDRLGGFELRVIGENVNELFSRSFLVYLMFLVYGTLLLVPTLRATVRSTPPLIVILVLFAVGALTALSDPNYTVHHEYNLIRYCTSGMLCAASLIAFKHLLGRLDNIGERLCAAFFGLLFLAGAVDELWQFHERSDELMRHVFSESNWEGQDLLTLLLGAGGVGTAILVVAAIFLNQRVKAAFTTEKYRQTLLFFSLAVFSFSFATLLDTFDIVLVAGETEIRKLLVGETTAATPYWLTFLYIDQAANSLEEFHEFLAAVLFLMMMGALFGVKTLGFNKEK